MKIKENRRKKTDFGIHNNQDFTTASSFMLHNHQVNLMISFSSVFYLMIV